MISKPPNPLKGELLKDVYYYVDVNERSATNSLGFYAAAER